MGSGRTADLAAASRYARLGWRVHPCAAYWTAADAAELDVLVWALVTDYAEHRQRCQLCARRGEPGSLPCPHLQAAIAEVVEWRDARLLLSRAEWLRREQEAAA